MKSGYKFKIERCQRWTTSAGEQLAFSNDSKAVNGPLVCVHLGYKLIALSVHSIMVVNSTNQSKMVRTCAEKNRPKVFCRDICSMVNSERGGQG